MIDERVIKWLIKASNDFRTAEELLDVIADPAIRDSIAFHCQQTVEKVLKAFLTHKEVDFGRTHDVEYLAYLCAQVDSDFNWVSKEVAAFLPYAVEIRYPDEFYIPSSQEVLTLFEIARKVKEFVFSKLGVADDDVDTMRRKLL